MPPPRKMQKRDVDILVVDDSQRDTEILALAFSRAGVKAQVEYVRDGQEAIDYLAERAKGGARGARLPAILLLDLSMRRRSGFDVLDCLREKSGVRKPAIVVFSGSDFPHDIRMAFGLGARSYMMKPIGFEGMVEIARRVGGMLGDCS